MYFCTEARINYLLLENRKLGSAVLADISVYFALAIIYWSGRSIQYNVGGKVYKLFQKIWF